ncbi:GntR family transcriptional regulator [Cellulosimicrobium cellulans]|uniref:GntR family transcriptional regulator n=1 Tax=Cellulosimicrobium cellulans TaxID=1710 RepID=UPI00214A8771|nr:GntR family transcriptional regulator [Cellulosimicrobium cellulans]
MDIPPVRDRRPLAVQVYDRLHDALTGPDEDLVVLPPEQELARRLAVSRTTVRQALALLEEDGVIERGAGRRRQVAHRVPLPLGAVRPLEEMVQTADEVAVERVVRRVSPATGWSARLLEIERGQDIATWECVVRAGSTVVASSLEVIEASHEPRGDGEGTMYARLSTHYRTKATPASLRLAPYLPTARSRPRASTLETPLAVTFTTRAPSGPVYLAKHVVDLRAVSLNLLTDAHGDAADDVP